jgi:hypothetical protein
MKLNINETIHVRLTDEGKRILSHTGGFDRGEDELGRHRFLLHEAMQVFGAHAYAGAKPFFEANELEIARERCRFTVRVGAVEIDCESIGALETIVERYGKDPR